MQRLSGGIGSGKTRGTWLFKAECLFFCLFKGLETYSFSDALFGETLKIPRDGGQLVTRLIVQPAGGVRREAQRDRQADRDV